jgi:hypothetical protein
MDIQHLQDHLPHQRAGNIVVSRRGGVPGFGPVAETARAAPFGQSQFHGPRLPFENFPPQGRFGGVEQLPAEITDRSPHARRSPGAGVNRLRRATELLGRQIHLSQRALQGLDDFLFGRSAAHWASDVGEELSGTSSGAICGAGFSSPPVTNR